MTETTSTTGTTSITMSHAQLASIASLAACVSTDDGLVLNGIHLIARDGRLTATATDRYVAGSIELYGDTFTAEFEVTVLAHVLTKFVAASKLTGRFNTDVARITLAVAGTADTGIMVTLSDQGTNASVMTPAIMAKFPPLEQLFPVIDETPVSIGHYGMSAALLAKLAKINVLGDKTPTWIVQHSETPAGMTSRAVLYYVPVAGRALFRVLVQPKRIPS